MRIIAGRFRRRILRAPKGHLTRPSTDRVRESLFNLVQSRLNLEGASVLDLFAGTGALGLEALSRGAAQSIFVELDPHVLKVARLNMSALDVGKACISIRGDAPTYLRRYRGEPFDLILADPPYDLADLLKLPELALPCLTPDGLFVLEHDNRHKFDTHPALDTSRPYGQTHVSIFRPTSQAADLDD
jgi:16S rRNA (guanine966-N2)-methyltransferase